MTGPSARAGFNNTLANKLLVMIDGRTVYTPLYAGVFWDAQNPCWRISTASKWSAVRAERLWGANAVNGVINIVTKSAQETQGLCPGAGRIASSGFRRGAIRRPSGTNCSTASMASGSIITARSLPMETKRGNDWDMTQGGFRVTVSVGRERIELQGDVYSGTEEGARRHRR